MKRVWLLFFILSAVSFRVSVAHAEYRVFQLEITSEDGKTRTVTTTLDHLQYPHLYPLNRGETIQYTDSWMCWENTSNRAPCVKIEAARATPSS